jgi:hypothetical protein
MPRFLRLGNEMIHVPSLSSATIGTNCFGRPLITLSYHATKSILYVRYGTWDSCQKDFNRIKNALNEVEDLLNKVPLTEPEARLLTREQGMLRREGESDLQEVNTIVEKKMVELKESIDTVDVLVKEGVKSVEATSAST